MSCNCGCGGKCGSGCGGDCGQPGKIITIDKTAISSSIAYKGSAITCAADSSIDIADGEGLNSVLQKVLTKLCALGAGGNYLASFDGNATVNSLGSTEVYTEEFGVGTVGLSEGIRVKVVGSFNSVVGGSGSQVVINYYGKDAGGTPTSKTALATLNIPVSTTADRFMIDAVVYISTSTAVIGNSEKKLPNTASLDDVLAISTAIPDTATFGSSISLDVTLSDAADVVNIDYMSIEHLRK